MMGAGGSSPLRGDPGSSSGGGGGSGKKRSHRAAAAAAAAAAEAAGENPPPGKRARKGRMGKMAGNLKLLPHFYDRI